MKKHIFGKRYTLTINHTTRNSAAIIRSFHLKNSKLQISS